VTTQSQLTRSVRRTSGFVQVGIPDKCLPKSPLPSEGKVSKSSDARMRGHLSVGSISRGLAVVQNLMSYKRSYVGNVREAPAATGRIREGVFALLTRILKCSV